MSAYLGTAEGVLTITSLSLVVALICFYIIIQRLQRRLSQQQKNQHK
jgi:preprotein translocase subunit YajC